MKPPRAYIHFFGGIRRSTPLAYSAEAAASAAKAGRSLGFRMSVLRIHPHGFLRRRINGGAGSIGRKRGAGGIDSLSPAPPIVFAFGYIIGAAIGISDGVAACGGGNSGVSNCGLPRNEPGYVRVRMGTSCAFAPILATRG